MMKATSGAATTKARKSHFQRQKILRYSRRSRWPVNSGIRALPYVTSSVLSRPPAAPCSPLRPAQPGLALTATLPLARHGSSLDIGFIIGKAWQPLRSGRQLAHPFGRRGGPAAGPAAHGSRLLPVLSALGARTSPPRRG